MDDSATVYELNADTRRKLAEIRRNGYFRRGTTLGRFGWSHFYSFGSAWEMYRLYSVDPAFRMECIEEITAQDDAHAVAAFGELYHLAEFEHQIVRVQTELIPISG